jgi:LacI family transcriptional regulator
MAIIRNSGYQPDILASALASKKVFRIAALIPGGTPDNPFWKYPITGIEEGLREISHFGVSLKDFTSISLTGKTFCPAQTKCYEASRRV